MSKGVIMYKYSIGKDLQKEKTYFAAFVVLWLNVFCFLFLFF